MTALSPRKFRSDFSDFLRGGHPQTQSTRNDMSPSLASVLPAESLHVPETPGRSRSRLPFLGRSRKKSSQRTDAVSDIDESDVLQPAMPSQDERLSVASSVPSATESEAGPASPSTSQASPSFLSRLTQRPKTSRKTSRHTLTNGYTSDSLVLPRPPSFESATSHASRSTTPRPEQPTITVLLSSDNMSDYRDLFTQPQKRSPSDLDHSSGRALPRSSISHLPPLPSSPVDDNSKRWSWKSNLDNASKSMSTLPDTRTPVKEKRKTVGSLPYQHEHRSSPSFSKSGIPPSPHHPPTVPLPATPNVTPPLTPLPAVPVPPDPPTITKRTRPRAHTLSSVSSRSSGHPDPPPRTKSIHSEKNETLDIDAASPEILRKTLRARNQQVDDLTASLLRASQAHQAEKHALEKKIAALERETARREKEIQGLVWLVNNGKTPNGSIDPASKPTPTIDVSVPPSSSSIKSPVLRRIHSDYDEESAASSGGESVASTQTTRARRSMRMAVKTDLRSRSSLRHSPVSNGPDLPLPEVPRLEKRGSVSSLASSAASSQSSLLIHNNPSTSTLSAIPEGPPPVPKIPSSSPKSHSSSLRDPAILAAINARRDKEHRRASMKASSLKSPPKATPAPTPAAAYAANLKKGLPPTIDTMIQGAPR